ncbi:HNH endonuclease (plasmid) [Rhizobium sp. BG4]|nr:HNH endonuclease [Rhizobium sp. BG4]
MRALPKPPFGAMSALDACASSIRDTALKDRLLSSSTAIAAAEGDYSARGDTMSLFAIQGSGDVASLLTTSEMMRVYAGTFVRSKATRFLYDLIKSAPKNDMCPLCGQRTVSTLDHYLAQSIHPNLTIVPLNLVPACAECNKKKLDFQPQSEVEQGFHPYFDDFDDTQWLAAEVMETTPAAIRFFVVAPSHWTEAKAVRAYRHFTSFDLGTLYSSHSGVEISNIRYSLEMVAAKGTPEDVRLTLLERAESARRVNLNSWQTATYQALADSYWYCNGGFLLT